MIALDWELYFCHTHARTVAFNKQYESNPDYYDIDTLYQDCIVLSGELFNAVS